MTEEFNQAFDDALMARAKRLNKDVQPENDLWPDIEAVIEAERTAPKVAPWHRYAVQAAALVLLVGGSSGLTYLALDGKVPNSSTTPVPLTVPLNAQTASFGDRYTLGPGFQDARRDLQSRLDVELERLSPEARAEVEMNMQTIRTAIDEINAALAEAPDNVLLQQLLLSSYREELALMDNVSGISNAVMWREDF